MVRKLALAVSLALGGFSISAHGLGLGDINANSVLNQNFNAEIKLLSASEDELDNLKVRLASAEAFSKAGVDRPFYLSMLRFAPGRGADGNLYVKVTSDFPIREPFLNFLIELNWPNGRLVREYTVLLDPPTTVRRAPPPVAAPVRQVQAPPVPKARPAERPASAPPVARPQTAPGEYGPVRSGETAWRIAERVRPQGVSVLQTLMALHRANPQAFINNNINKLRRGQILRIPSREEIAELSAAEARLAFQASQRDSALASQPPAPVARQPKPVERVEPIARDAAPTARPAPGAVAEPDGGRLKIATARPQDQGRAGAEGDATKVPDAVSDTIQRQLLIAQENAETSRQEAENLRDRVDELELQLRELQRMLTVRDDSFARIQAGVASEDEVDTGAAGVVSAEEAAEVAAIDSAAESLEQDLIAAQQAADAAMDVLEGGMEPAAEDPTPAASEAAGEQRTAMPVADAPVDGAPAASELAVAPEPEPVVEPVIETDVAESPVVEAVAEETAEAPAVEAAASTPPQTEAAKPFGRRWLEQNWPFVAGGVGGLAGLGILLGLLLGRRRPADEEALIGLAAKRDSEEAAPVPEADTEAEVDAAIAAVTREYAGDQGKPTDADDTVVVEASQAGAASSSSDVDPLSEADVYIAYGRYQQAEELLKAATRREPKRLDLKLKLLEIHYATRNRSGFVALAAQMAESGDDRIDVNAWDRVQEMGRELDPENALFEVPEGRAVAAAAAAAGVAAASSVDDDDLSLDDLAISELASDLDAETDIDVDEKIDDEIGASDLDMALDLDDLEEGAGEGEPLAGESIEDLESLELEFPDLDATAGVAGDADEGDEEDFERREGDVHPALDLDGSLEGVEQVDEESILNIDTDLDADELQAQLDELSDLSMLDTEMAAPGAIDQQSLDQPIDLEAALANLGGDSELASDAVESYATAEHVNEEDVETKLDLARAYIEMGDGEGARSLLGEVQQEGNEEQKLAAIKLLAEVETEA